jgi:putative transposase
MRHLSVLFIHFISTLARLLGPGGVRSLVAESLLLKHQLLILNRSRKRSPNLSAQDRILAGRMAILVRPTRLLRSAIALKPSTLLALHKALSKQKYRMLFSLNRRRKPGPKGPTSVLIHAVVEMKQRNPNWGCPRIAQQIALAFHIPIDKDVVRRILAHHYLPGQDSGGPSWLTFLGHMKDSLWSMDLFRCESATMRTHWVLVVMDQYTRRILGFGVHAGKVDGVARIHRWKGERRRFLRHDQQPIPARFDGNLTVGPSTRHLWLPDLAKARARCDTRSTSANLPRKHLVFLHRRAFRGSDRFTATACVPKVKLSSLSQRNYRQNRRSRNNSPATGSRGLR